MNAASRALAQGSFSKMSGWAFSLSPQNLGILLLMISVLFSALSVVYVKDLNRQLFCKLQSLKQQRDELQVQKNQLLLEENTWASSTRVQTIAHDRLGMVLPAAKDVILITVSRPIMK